jgi:predicted ATPase
MYLETGTIRAIKCFADVPLDFRNADGSIRRWNVLIGENGTGKTTLLQTLALALMGEKAASVLLPRPDGWIRDGAAQGEITATIVPSPFDQETKEHAAKTGTQPGTSLTTHTTIATPAGPGSVSLGTTTRDAQTQQRLHHLESQQGWFAAGYGPFRRLHGNTKETQQMVEHAYREARFITLFREDAALTTGADWLMELDHIRRDQENPQQETASQTIDLIATVITSLLPEGWQFKGVNSRGVFFATPYSAERRIGDLSDGYRAMLALALDLLHHLHHAYGPLLLTHLPDLPGVVLIDELDAHLHPTWQRTVGTTLKHCFPNLQFIVATHSPFIPQIADDDGIYTLRQEGRTVRAIREEPSVRGWRVDQILAILFGTASAYDPDTEERLREYGQLKILADETHLTEEQHQRFQELQAWVAQYLAPPGESRAEMFAFQVLDNQIKALSDQFRKEQMGDQG